MFVMVIMAVAAAIIVPTIGAGRRQREVRQTLQQFVASVRQASAMSIFQRRRVELRVWPDDGEYLIVEPRRGREGAELELAKEAGISRGKASAAARFRLPESAIFGEIAGGRRDDMEELGTISFDFFPTGSSSGGEIEIIFENDRNRQAYLLKLHPLVSRISMEDDS
jgi:type II secretory pathway pseudopilin PulG